MCDPRAMCPEGARHGEPLRLVGRAITGEWRRRYFRIGGNPLQYADFGNQKGNQQYGG